MDAQKSGSTERDNAVAIPVPSARDITSLADIVNSGLQVTDASEVLGDGTTICENKDVLIDRKLYFLSWRFNESKTITGPDGQPAMFVSAVALELDSKDTVVERWLVNDGSTGILRDLMSFSERTGEYGGLLAQKGLTKSTYETTDEKGNPIEATTYYISSARRR